MNSVKWKIQVQDSNAYCQRVSLSAIINNLNRFRIVILNFVNKSIIFSVSRGGVGRWTEWYSGVMHQTQTIQTSDYYRYLQHYYRWGGGLNVRTTPYLR